MEKLLSIIPIFNLKAYAGLIGIIQAAVKFIKEVLTLIVDLLYPVIPSAKFKAIIDKVRKIVNKIDEILEKIKGWFLK